MVKCCHLASIILGSDNFHCYEGALFESAGTATTEPISDAEAPFPRTFLRAVMWKSQLVSFVVLHAISTSTFLFSEPFDP